MSVYRYKIKGSKDYRILQGGKSPRSKALIMPSLQSGKQEEFLEETQKANKIHTKLEKSRRKLYKKQSGRRRGEKPAASAVWSVVGIKGLVIKAGLAPTGLCATRYMHSAARLRFPLLWEGRKKSSSSWMSET